jgi:hypothetical protein
MTYNVPRSSGLGMATMRAAPRCSTGEFVGTISSPYCCAARPNSSMYIGSQRNAIGTRRVNPCSFAAEASPLTIGSSGVSYMARRRG